MHRKNSDKCEYISIQYVQLKPDTTSGQNLTSCIKSSPENRKNLP